MNNETLIIIAISLVKIAVVLGVVLLTVAYLTYLERKIIGHMQVRMGPMVVGWHGLLQPIADGIKLFFKEEIIPSQVVSKFIFLASPVIAMGTALMTFAVIPFGADITILGRTIQLQIADINAGILFIFAMASIGVYGVILGGWSSNSKYSFLGGIRGSAQMISYEVSMGLAVIGVLMIAGSTSMREIVSAQKDVWFVVYQPVGFLIYFTAALAELNRAPFDLPEAETELVSGFATEYSSMKYGMFFLGEYANMITVSAVATTFFLGGWQGPLLPSVVWFALKTFVFLFLMIWIRATWPRFRYDQLMHFGWKVLLPLSILNIAVTGLVMVLV